MKFKNKYLSISYNINVSKKMFFKIAPPLEIPRRTDITFYVLGALQRKGRNRKYVVLPVSLYFVIFW